MSSQGLISPLSSTEQPPGGRQDSTSSWDSPVDLEILFATASFFSLPGDILAHLSQISEMVLGTPVIGIGTPFTTANPIATSRGTSLCQLLSPLTTKEPLANESPVSVVLETWLDLAWNAVAAAPPLPHALDQQTAI